MGGHRSKPADTPPVLIQVVEEDPLLALRMLASLRRDGFMVEVYSVPRADDDAGGGTRPEQDRPRLTGALRGGVLSADDVEPDRAPHAPEGDGPAGQRSCPSAATNARGHGGRPMQLVARVWASLPPDGNADGRIRCLAIGPFEIDRGTHRAKRDGRPVHLGPTDFRLFEFFLERPNVAQSREAIRAGVWGEGSAINERTIDVQVGRLRRAVSKGAERNPILSIRGVGYVFEPVPEATANSRNAIAAAPSLQPSREQRQFDGGQSSEA